MNLEFSPNKVLKTLFITIFILLIGNIITIYLLPLFDYNYDRTAIRLLNFDTEQNTPTLFSFLILSISSFLLFHIAESRKKLNTDFKTWFLLAYIFAFLALDETLSLHEIISSFLQKTFGLKGVFFYAWIIPYGIALMAISIPIIKLLIKLPKEISKLFIISGFIFIIGAVGFEIFEGNIHDSIGKNNRSYIISYTIEETLEMVGISLFIYALLKYILIAKIKPITIGFKTTPS